jgi:hypothetical protein
MARQTLVRTGFLLAALFAAMPHASADEPAPASSSASTDAATERGRAAYQRGVTLAKAEQWGDALAAFEEAAAARDAPVVEANIAYCQRALGHYVAAREITTKLLANPAGLAPSQIEDAKGYLSEFERVLVKVKVTLDPTSATLTVDGRPLTPATESGVFLAGIAKAGDGTAPGPREFTIVLDPGSHLFRASRPGHQDAVVQRSYRPGDATSLNLTLDELPATIAIRSEPASAIVRVDKREVGVAPIEVQRKAGQYRVEVVQDKYESYAATLNLHPGQRADLTAKLILYKEPLTKKWWFWTGAVAVVAAGAIVTYVVTRPAPQPPPYEKGSTGWLVQPNSFRW